MDYQVCSRCIMDTTVPRITFNSEGVCNFCIFHDQLEEEHPQGEVGKAYLNKIYNKVRRVSKTAKYDCVVGISGGRDSTYLLWYLSKEIGLRCLAVHFNDGFGNPTAGKNMQNAANKLGVEIRTISADWREAKELKLCMLKASTPDLTLPTDVGLTAALYGVAASEGIKTIFVGHSFRTEGVMPLEWTYLDGYYLNAVHKQYSPLKLRKWNPSDPGFHLNWYHLFYYSVFKGISLITPYYWLDYVRTDVDKILKSELDWVYPGAHYFDDLYQSLVTYVLRKKFNIDRRISNYSALIRSGQMTRSDGLESLKEIYVIENPKVINLCIKRLGLTEEEFEKLIDVEAKYFYHYPNLLAFLRKVSIGVYILAKLNIIPKSTYSKYCGKLI